MKVLIVDDEPTSRLLLGRIIAREFGLTIVEAANGREALDQLAKQAFDFILLDLLMPGMDGIETLAAIRASEAHRALPVVILSAVKDEQAVRRILELGVSDYLAKPLHPQHIVSRLSNFLKTLRLAQEAAIALTAGLDGPPGDGAGLDASPLTSTAASAPAARSSTPGVGARPGTPAGPPTVEIVVADGEAQFRALVRSLLGSDYRIIEAETGARALRRCQESRPAMLLLGEELGAVDRPLLARKIRAAAELRGIKLVAAAPAARRDALRQDPLYDGFVSRTLSAQTFQDDFAVAARELEKAQGAGELVAGVRLRIEQTVEQVFGMMLGLEMRLRPDPPPASGIWIRAEIGLTLTHEDFTLAVVCACPVETGLLFASKASRVSSDWVGGDTAAAALGDIAAIITERLQQALSDQGRRVQSTLAEVRREPARMHENALLTLAFDAAAGDTPFRVLVMGQAKALHAGASARGAAR